MINPNDVTLGCPEEYSVIVVARDLETYAARLDWSSISWSRVLDDISEASVVVPDSLGGLRCNLEIGDSIVPWKFGLRIERNGQEVWSGPITTMERPERADGSGSADHVVIGAHDAMIWTGRRIVTQNLSFTNEDAGVVFRSVLADAMSLDNPMGLEAPQFNTGYTMTREVVQRDWEYVDSILTGLANSAVDYFMLGRELVVYDGVNFGWFVQRNGTRTRIARTSDPFGRYIFGLFTDEAFNARPSWLLDGLTQANDIIVPGADSGEAGFRRYWRASDVDLTVGLLTRTEVIPLYRPESIGIITDDQVFQQAADSRLALTINPVSVLSGASLSQSAPVRVENLLPGSLWAIDLGDIGIAGLVDVQRLKAVDVTVEATSGGVIENVVPRLIPLGSDESVAS